MFGRAAALGLAGKDLIHLGRGRPIHDTPQPIKDATIAALQAGQVHYGDLQGEPSFRAALSEKLRSFNRIDASPDEVIVTNGLTQASFAAIFALVDPGAEVILLDPSYPQHFGKVQLAVGRVVPLPPDPAATYRIRAALTAPRPPPRTT